MNEELANDIRLCLASFRSEMSYWNQTNPNEYNDRRLKEICSQVDGLIRRIDNALIPAPPPVPERPLIVVPEIVINGLDKK